MIPNNTKLQNVMDLVGLFEKRLRSYFMEKNLVSVVDPRKKMHFATLSFHNIFLKNGSFEMR